MDDTGEGADMEKATCAINGCTRQAICRTWCGLHYDRWRRTGSLERPTVEDRFWAKADKSSGSTPSHRPDLGPCWLWTAYALDSGYGKFSYGTRANPRCVLAHRFAYQIEVGPIDAGLELDHLCRVRNCVRFTHLEPVTGVENNLRSESPTAINARKTHCVRGHAFNESNTRITPAGWRACRQCRAMYRTGLGGLVR